MTLRYRGYEFGESGMLHKKVDPDFEELDALELLARLSVHVPLPRKHHTHYRGAYSTRFRGRLRKLGIAPRPEAEGKLRKECRQAWARLIKHLYQDDPLACPECGEQMKLVRLVGPGSARDKFKQLRPSLLYYGDRGVIHREPLAQPP